MLESWRASPSKIEKRDETEVRASWDAVIYNLFARSSNHSHLPNTAVASPDLDPGLSSPPCPRPVLRDLQLASNYPAHISNSSDILRWHHTRSQRAPYPYARAGRVNHSQTRFPPAGTRYLFRSIYDHVDGCLDLPYTYRQRPIFTFKPQLLHQTSNKVQRRELSP